MRLALKNMTQQALRAIHSQHRVSAQNLGSCWCPQTLHPQHCSSHFSPLKPSQDATMSSGTQIVLGVPEGRGRISATSYRWGQAEFVTYSFESDYHLPLFTRGEGHEKLLMLRQAIKAWQNMIKMQPTANASTIISPKVPYVEKITATKMW